MSRKDALLRLHERLIAKRKTLRRKLSDEISLESGESMGDVGDAANDGTKNDLNSQLAALESRELWQVERAIDMIREGRYGLCEMCEEQIPIARLNALPFTPMCVECQRKQEDRGILASDDADWESVFEHEGRMSDRELTIGDLDLEP